MKNCQTPPDFLKTVHGTSPMQEINLNLPLATDALAWNAVHENGYGPSPGKHKTVVVNSDVRHCQHGQNIQARTSEAQLFTDSLPRGSGTKSVSNNRDYETWKTNDRFPQELKNDSKTGNSHSEVTKIVPLKPQRSKKSLNKDVSSTQSWSDRRVPHGNATQSSDGSAQVERSVDADVMQQPFRGPAGQSQSQRGGENLQNTSDFKDVLFCCSKVPTAPPRSLPLKTHWSRDRHGNMDNSHIHHQPAGQETSKRKRAVKPTPPPRLSIMGNANHCQKHCMSFGRHHLKADRTHTPELMRLRTRKQKFTFLRIASLAQRAFCFPSFLSAALDIRLVIGQITKPQTSRFIPPNLLR